MAVENDGGEPKVSIYLLDDHEVVRLGLRQLLDSQPDMEVVGVAGTCAQAVQEINRLHPRILVTEARLPDGDGVLLWRDVQSRMPGMSCLVFTLVQDDNEVREAAIGGVSGYVLKGAKGGGIVEAIRAVASGRRLLGPPSVDGLLDQVIGRSNSGAQA